MKKHVLLLCCLSILGSLVAQEIPPSLEDKVIQWRHEIHQNPELSNREFKTAEKVAAHLKNIGHRSTNRYSPYGSDWFT